jgi:hypothetical protein
LLEENGVEKTKGGEEVAHKTKAKKEPLPMGHRKKWGRWPKEIIGTKDECAICHPRPFCPHRLPANNIKLGDPGGINEPAVDTLPFRGA